MPNSVSPSLAKLIVDNATAYAVLTLDLDGTVTSWLAGSEALTGYTADEMVGASIVNIFTEPDRAANAHLKELALAQKVGRVEDTRWHLRKDGSQFWANGLSLRVESESFDGVIKIFRDETPSKQADEQRVLMLNELNHRVKNTLTIVQSVADQTLRSAGVAEPVRRALSDRIVAMARAHDVLVEQTWAGADLEIVIRRVIEPLDRSPSVFSLDGPPTRLSPVQAVSCAMALHELCTNATKYGALSALEGRVRLSWNLSQSGSGDRHLRLLWTERGGPPVAAPGRRGFGSRMIERAFAAEPDGSARLTYAPEGVECLMEMALVDQAESQTALSVGHGSQVRLA